MQANFYHGPMLAATISQVVPLMIGGIFILAGIVVAVFCFRQKRITAAAQSWPSVRGKIVKSTVEDRTRPKTGTNYYIAIEYTYRVSDLEHRNNKIGFGSTLQSRSKSETEERLARDYPVGKEVTVFYNPEDPAQSVINNQPTKWWVGLPVAGAFVLAGVIIASLRSRM